MIKGIYKTASAMLPRILMQETIANNLSNAETGGFKREAVFMRELTQAQQKKQDRYSDWQTPMVDGIYVDYSQGSLERTNEPLNVALDGSGFLVVSTPNGEAYTRAGDLHLSADRTLVNADNYPVLTESGPLVIQGDQVSIGIDGRISVDGNEIGQLRLVDFEKPYQLDHLEGGLYRARPGATPTEPQALYVRQGYLERSNVDIVREMVDMIASYRNFESDQRAIQILDETVGKAVNEVGRVS